MPANKSPTSPTCRRLFSSAKESPGRETSCSIHTKNASPTKTSGTQFPPCGRGVQQIRRGRDMAGGKREKWSKINPMLPPMSTGEIDASFDLPYTRMPHPRYRGKQIPAYEMIRHSVCMHRGCFGGCAFCTISAHQGKFIASRSKESIMKEVESVTLMPDFKGYISDLGGPSANMYAMGGRNRDICRKWLPPVMSASGRLPESIQRPPATARHLPGSGPRMPVVKKSFIGSGVRYDLANGTQQRRKRECSQPGISADIDRRPCERPAESRSGTHFRRSAAMHEKTGVRAIP